MTYKVLKHLNLTNKDTIENNNIAYKKWIEHHKSLWCSNFPQKTMINQKQLQPHR